MNDKDNTKSKNENVKDNKKSKDENIKAVNPNMIFNKKLQKNSSKNNILDIEKKKKIIT